MFYILQFLSRFFTSVPRNLIVEVEEKNKAAGNSPVVMLVVLPNSKHSEWIALPVFVGLISSQEHPVFM